MANVNEYLRLTYSAQIKNLSGQRDQNITMMEGFIKDIENAGEDVAIHRETIESCQRLIKDLTDNVILFGNKQINNLKMNNDEIDELIDGLKEKLEELTEPEPAKVKAPAKTSKPRTLFGELTNDQMKVIRKKYAVLLELRGASLYEYLEFLKSKDRPETNKAISLSLGKNPNWYSNMTLLARKAGYDA